MTPRLLCVLTLLVLAACATPTRTAQPTGSSGPTSTLSIPTSTTIGGVVPTGRGPSAFTTTSAPGPIQVIVEDVACVQYAGDGWRVRWRLENHATVRVHGPLAARVDDSEPTLIAPDLALPAGGRLVGTSTVKGQGESVIVAWKPAERPAVVSFPVEVPDCRVDPADERAARQATTTGKP
jgi:hypothetical protein